MSESDLHTFVSSTYGVDFDSLSTDAENVMRRSHENGWAPELDLYIGIDGLVYIREA